MAKHKTSTKLVPFRMTPPRPIVVRSTKIVKAKVKHHKKHGGASRGLTDKRRMGIVVGGLAVGFIQKQGIKLPELPLLGQAGTIGLAAYLVSDGGKNKLADEICTAALTIAAYELGSTGSIVGEDEGGGGFVGGV